MKKLYIAPKIESIHFMEGQLLMAASPSTDLPADPTDKGVVGIGESELDESGNWSGGLSKESFWGFDEGGAASGF